MSFDRAVQQELPKKEHPVDDALASFARISDEKVRAEKVINWIRENKNKINALKDAVGDESARKDFEMVVGATFENMRNEMNHIILESYSRETIEKEGLLTYEGMFNSACNVAHIDDGYLTNKILNGVEFATNYVMLALTTDNVEALDKTILAKAINLLQVENQRRFKISKYYDYPDIPAAVLNAAIRTYEYLQKGRVGFLLDIIRDQKDKTDLQVEGEYINLSGAQLNGMHDLLDVNGLTEHVDIRNIKNQDLHAAMQQALETHEPVAIKLDNLEVMIDDKPVKYSDAKKSWQLREKFWKNLIDPENKLSSEAVAELEKNFILNDTRFLILPEINLSHANMDGSNFSYLNIRYGYLAGASFDGCNLESAKFHLTDLSQAEFNDCNMLKVSFYRSDLTDTVVRTNCENLDGVNYDEANIAAIKMIAPEKQGVRKVKTTEGQLEGHDNKKDDVQAFREAKQKARAEKDPARKQSVFSSLFRKKSKKGPAKKRPERTQSAKGPNKNF